MAEFAGNDPFDANIAFDAGGIFCTPPTDDIVPPVYIPDSVGAPGQDPYYPCDPLMQRLMRHYRQQTRGRNLFLMSDGTVIDSQNQTPPNMIQPPTDPYSVVYDATSGSLVVTTVNQTPYVVRTLYGGSSNPVTSAEAAQLTAAGYGGTLT